MILLNAQIIVYFFLIFQFLILSSINSTTIHELNEAIFLDPRTHSALIRCPLDFTHSSDIQWYDVANHRYESDRGRYYRINGTQPFDREFICSTISKIGVGSNEKYRIKIRTYDHPLNIRHAFVRNITNTSITVDWEDDSYNRNANITYYELVLKYNNTIQYRTLVNGTLLSYTFPSLYPNTLYSIDISAVDVWKRYSGSITINSTTLSMNSNENKNYQFIDRHIIEQSVICYRLDTQLLLVEFNRSQLLSSNYIYNITIYDYQDHVALTDNHYEQEFSSMKSLTSFIYRLKRKSLTFKIKFIFSTNQMEYVETIVKYCDDFHPMYSPLTCSIKSTGPNNHHLMIHMQLYNSEKQIYSLKPNNVFYRTSRTHFIKKNIYDIHKYVSANVIDVKDNYSVIVENNIIDNNSNEKINVSILCPITRIAPSPRIHVKRENRILGGIIAGLILSIISLTALAVFIAYRKGLMPDCRRMILRYVYLIRKKHHPRSNLVQINGSIEGNVSNGNSVNYFDANYKEFDSTSIAINQFANYVARMHKDGDFGFVRLFEDICEVSKNYTFPADVSQIDYNKPKNRYTNILTYDHSRVKLSSEDRDGRGNYINANYVDGHQKANAYIATQGPMPNTINDFWRMIWEKDVNVLVMITNIKERGRVKCDLYWPQEGSETYGTIQVTLVSTISFAYYVKRIFSIRCKANRKRITYERLVHQFHYTDWPDHGVPLFTLPVLSFIRHSSACNPETGGPIVVHCSAGVGRTGTYIVVDTMLKKIREQHSLNIPSFLKHIRQQRNFLVQTEEQFIFIYDVLLEAIQLLNIGYNELELNDQNFDYIIQMLDYFDKDSNLTRLDKQFQLVVLQNKTNDYQLSFGQMEENLGKNRTQAIVPFNPCRVILAADRKQQPGGEYINASYMHGCHRVDEFIITQHPMMNTITDFWQMIWSTNTSIIVSLYADEKSQPDVPDFWPLPSQLMDCGSFSVCLIDERFECEYIYRDFLLQSTEEDYELRVKIVSSTYWPDACSPLKASFNLINTIRKLRMNTKSSGSIVVHDLFGGHRAATFCALYTISEQIEIEGTLNIYELAKLYHIKRPGIWRHNGDLFYLYRCAEVLFREIKLPTTYNQNQTSSYHRRYLPHQYNTSSQPLDEPIPITSYTSTSIQPVANSSTSSSSAFANVAQTVMDSFSKRRQKSRSYRSQTLKKILFLNNESPL
ncbi:unnamed protein product [Adineta steineri]|uniref:Protein-tyrosine-phosphatase n=1 Tax=Adineta steineri TaxID=433720 RepID=A0A815E9L9_9BILA|nr:unnamed protein product [Adineta steineri]CAF3674235.1 unnamed protein product [Adineta steineri]